MKFVLYYAMTQRYFQMFFGVQEKMFFANSLFSLKMESKRENY